MYLLYIIHLIRFLSCDCKLVNLNLTLEQSSLGRLSTNAELLRVDRVVHKAVINVDLEGTEGAAASFVEIHPLSFDTERPLEVVVDRPFLYMVYDRVNRIPILLGKMVDPTQ